MRGVLERVLKSIGSALTFFEGGTSSCQATRVRKHCRNAAQRARVISNSHLSVWKQDGGKVLDSPQEEIPSTCL